jgi:hypothetical protein
VFPHLRPFYRRKSLLTHNERDFYKALCAVVRGYAILAKVRLVDLIGADDRHKFWQANFRRVCSKHIDFVVCDSDLRPILAIELDDLSHQREDRRRRDSDINQLFAAVSFPLLRIAVQDQYRPEELSQRIIETVAATG